MRNPIGYPTGLFAPFSCAESFSIYSGFNCLCWGYGMVPHTKPHLILHESTEGYNSLIQHFLAASAVFEIQQDRNCTLKDKSFLGHFAPDFISK